MMMITSPVNPTQLQSLCNQRPFHLHPLIHYQLNIGALPSIKPDTLPTGNTSLGDWLYQEIAPNYQGVHYGMEDNSGGVINDFTSTSNNRPHRWTKPINFGGVAGNAISYQSDGDAYYSYLSYETEFATQ